MSERDGAVRRWQSLNDLRAAGVISQTTLEQAWPVMLEDLGYTPEEVARLARGRGEVTP